MRILFSILVLFLIVSLPYWIYLPMILVGIIIFPFYIEAIVFGFIIDVVYGVSGGFISGFIFALIAAVLVYFAVPLRERLRFNV